MDTATNNSPWEPSTRRFLNLKDAMDRELGIDPAAKLTDRSAVLAELWTPVLACVTADRRDEMLDRLEMIHQWYIRQSAASQVNGIMDAYAAGVEEGRLGRRGWIWTFKHRIRALFLRTRTQ